MTEHFETLADRASRQVCVHKPGPKAMHIATFQTMALVLADILAAHENSKIEFKARVDNIQSIVREVIRLRQPHRRHDRDRRGRQVPRGRRRRRAQDRRSSRSPRACRTTRPYRRWCPNRGHDRPRERQAGRAGAGPPLSRARSGDAHRRSCYERISPSTKKVGAERLEAMRVERGGRSSFDQLPVLSVGLDALDVNDARRRYSERGTILSDALMRTFEITTEVNGDLVPTNGGLLLFGHVPQTVHPDAICLCARFRGVRKGADILDQDEIRSGSMLTILGRMDAFIDRQPNRVPPSAAASATTSATTTRSSSARRSTTRCPRRLQRRRRQIPRPQLRRPPDHREPRAVGHRDRCRRGPCRPQQDPQPRDHPQPPRARLHRGTRHLLGQGPHRPRRARLPAPNLRGHRPQPARRSADPSRRGRELRFRRGRTSRARGGAG